VRVSNVRVEELLRAEVVDENGTVRPIAAVCGEAPSLFVFLRHFGCHGCHAQVDQVVPQLDALTQAGIRTIFVGSGESRMIGPFIDRVGLRGRPAEVVSDPSLRAHHAAAMRRSFWGSGGPPALIDLVRLRAQGYRGTRIEGDIAQQGGVVALDRARNVVLHRAARSLGDLADGALVRSVIDKI
jgi:hypothetical protein